MIHKKSILHVLVITFFVLATGLSAATAAGEVVWNDYDNGLGLGKNSQKKIMINFWAKWCGYCKKMDKETFRAAKVVDYLNANFISIKINLNSDENKKLARAYQVNGLPATVFLAENGDKIGTRHGWVKADKFLELLEFVHTEGYK